VMPGVFDPRVFSAETHNVGGETEGEAEEREGAGAGEAGPGGARGRAAISAGGVLEARGPQQNVAD
jgi:hypothetical protein